MGVVVDELERKEYVSKTNGKTYVSYRCKCKYQKNDGLWYGTNLTIDDVAIQNLIERKVIKSSEDIKGKEIELACKYPIFLNENNIKYGLIYNYVISVH